MPTQVHGSTIKITDRHLSDLYPTKQEEILRSVRLEGNFRVDGSIYCHQLTAVGPGRVVGPVLSRGDITLENRTKRTPQKFLAGLFCRSNILCHSTPREPVETLAADIENVEFLVCGDIAAERVSLHNAVVLGNVRGTTVQVNDSIILGGIVADEEAIISNSCFLTFESKRVRLLGRNSCLVPHGTAGSHIAWEDYTSPGGVTVPSEMRYVAVCRTKECGCECKDGDLACGVYMAGECDKTSVRLSPRDRFEMDDGAGGSVSVLNIGGRVLNLQPIARQLDAMTSFVREMLTYEHYDEASQTELRGTWEARFTPSEVWLLRQLADSVEEAGRHADARAKDAEAGANGSDGEDAV